jgi:hypothetical protein
MGTFADTANVNYRLSLPMKDNKVPFFIFLLRETNGRLPFLFSVYSKETEVAVFLQFSFPYIFTYSNDSIYIYLYLYIC